MNATIEITVRQWRGGVRVVVYIIRQDSASRIYYHNAVDEKCISLASVRRAMRLQAAMLEVKP